MIETILGLVVGGISRFISEYFKTSKEDKKQYYEERILQKQIELEKIRANYSAAISSSEKDIAHEKALAEAIKGQSVITGTWVDALSASVRPIITYLIVGLYFCVKVSLMIKASELLWLDEDVTILGSVLGFWFVDRTLIKK